MKVTARSKGDLEALRGYLFSGHDEFPISYEINTKDFLLSVERPFKDKPTTLVFSASEPGGSALLVSPYLPSDDECFYFGEGDIQKIVANGDSREELTLKLRIFEPACLKTGSSATEVREMTIGVMKQSGEYIGQVTLDYHLVINGRFLYQGII